MVNPDPLQMMEPDEHGAELGKEARVWKVYVKETGPLDTGSALGSLAHSLPIPVYCTVVYITCHTKSDDERTLCKRLLSRFAFPRMNGFLVPAMNQIMSKLWQTYRQADPKPTFLGQFWGSPVAQLWPSTSSRNMLAAARSRHFAATQLWLLLHLVDNSSTCQQQDLKRIIEAKTGLGVQYTGVNEVKLRLAEEIIEGYTEGHHLGVYSARVIECILQAHDFRNYAYDVLSHRINYHLRGVPNHLRGLLSLSKALPHPHSSNQAPSTEREVTQSNLVPYNGTSGVSHLASPPLSSSPSQSEGELDVNDSWKSGRNIGHVSIPIPFLCEVQQV